MKIKKVKLVKVPKIDKRWAVEGITSHFPPLALGIITAYLKKNGLEVNQDDLDQKIHYAKFNLKKNINLDLLNDPHRIISFLKGKKDAQISKLVNQMVNLTDFKNFDIFLIAKESLYSVSTNMSLLLLCKYLKNKYNKPIVIGGDLIEELIAMNSNLQVFDYAIKGPGEIAVNKLITSLNSNKKLDNIKGLIYWKNGTLIENKLQYEPIFIKPDFKGLPLELYKWEPPSWMKKHTGIKKKQKILIIPIRFITGCPNQCAFCRVTRSLQFLKPVEVVKLLKELKEEYNSNHFIFFSNMLNISKSYINELCDEIIKSKLKIYWSDSFYPSNLDKETIIKIKKAGCIHAVIGFETGSPKLLNSINRTLDINETSSIIKNFDSEGIWVTMNLIAGLPKEMKADTEYNLNFLNKNRKHIDEINTFPFSIMLDSNMGKFPEKYDIELKSKNYLPTNFDKKTTHTPVLPYIPFDEKNGLKWIQKSKQLDHIVNRIKTEFPELIPSHFLEDMPIIYYLYSNIDNKNKIKHIKKQITKNLFRKYLYKYPFKSIKQFFKIKNITQIINKLRRII